VKLAVEFGIRRGHKCWNDIRTLAGFTSNSV
jgi:hypothetical protein